MRRERTWIVFLALGVAAFWLWSDSRPPEKLPPSAKNVKYWGSSGWQYWEYYLRFDADPKVCREFAIELMLKHGAQRADIIENSDAFMPSSDRYPTWFDVETVESPFRIYCRGWIYAVVDQKRGRLYYKGFN